MARTNCKVHMEFIDTSAVADSNYSAEDNATIGNIELLKEEKEYAAYGLLEKNSFLLDESKTILQGNSKLPFVSADISLEDCNFGKNPVLIAEFSNNHTSAGITLCFVDDYPAEIIVKWYNLSGELLASHVFNPDSLQYYCELQVLNYGKLHIEFTKTRLPHQRVKIQYVRYGTVLKWSEESIKEASLSEEVDVTSATIPINTAELSIVDHNNDFELSNQNGAWKSIQKKQSVTIIEEVGRNQVAFGTLFVDTWKSSSNIVSLSLIDTIGLMDKAKFYGGKVYVDVAAGEIIDDVMESAGITKYSVAKEVAGILLTGHIPICTHREALQQIVFACGAVADCSRIDGVRIYMPDRYADKVVGADRKFAGTMIEMDDYVSGVAVTYYLYNLSGEVQEIFKDVLPAGETLIEFSEPYKSINVAGGTLKEAKTNYVIVYMEESGECVVSGTPYKKNEVTYTATVDVLEAGEQPNVISYSGCTMFNAKRVREVAEHILDYYQLRQVVSMRYLLDTESAGEWINIRDVKGSMVSTGIINQTIDLTGGFIASAKCRGYSVVLTDYVYTGEIYAGERGLI